MTEPIGLGDKRTLHVEGHAVAEYRWRPDLPQAVSPRPFLHPVRTLSGTGVTELMPADHLHQLGVSVAVQDAGGANFWGGRTYVRGRGSVPLPNHGVQMHRRWIEQTAGTLVHELDWIGPDGRKLLRERRRLAAIRLRSDAWALDFKFGLTNSTDAPLEFKSPAVNGRAGAGYGGFFWRAPLGEGNIRVTGPGLEGTPALHGAATPWLAVSGSGPAPWTLVFASGDGDPWFVRSGDYVGVGAALAWAEPLVAAPGAGPTRRIITVIADGALDAEASAALARSVSGGSGPGSRPA